MGPSYAYAYASCSWYRLSLNLSLLRLFLYLAYCFKYSLAFTGRHDNEFKVSRRVESKVSKAGEEWILNVNETSTE